MDSKQLLTILEDRYTELVRLMGDDQSKSIDWYDGARHETERMIYIIKKEVKNG